MPFDKVDTQVDFPAQERAMLRFWEETGAFEKLRAKNRGKPKWSFLDGPITANNPMGVHHAWGRTYKDAYQRYFAMTGHELRYQNGFDCQGLWVEVEVEKELKADGRRMESKRDIEDLVAGDRFASIDEFVKRCKARVDKFARVQTEQSIRLGYWMDWDRDDDWQKPADQRRSYFTMSEENNYTIWSFLKRCHDRGLVYRGYDAMPWCPRCGVGISQMEMHEGYQLVAHRSVFVRFPLRGRPPHPPGPPLPQRGEGGELSGSPLPSVGEGLGVRGENLLVWTTTPWTLTSNVAAAVNPELTYLKVKHRDQVYYLAKGAFTAKRLEEEFKQKEYKQFTRLEALEQIFKKRGGFDVVGELKGAEMVGWEYDGPFDELPAQSHPAGYPAELARVVLAQRWGPNRAAREIHRVVAWADVGETEGTGIVHIAPGCGQEDFHLGTAQGLVPVAPLDESGNFLPGFGELEGKSAVDPATTDWILTNLKQKGLLLEVERYPHNYPHCWRCKTELLFRLVDEWFINMKWRDEIMAVVAQAKFLPEEINGQARELDWLKNMGDWMISKKRFWGLALPIWVDEKTCDFEVIGSREELRQRAVEGWQEFEGRSPHRPWIDKVKLRNPKTGNLMSRIPDVGNPWLDAGIVPYSTMKYNTDRKYWEEWFPTDFITESFPGQFRNWFYAILAMSTMMEHRAPFKVLLGHGQVRDQWGDEMHKAKGNSIPFEGAADGVPLPGTECRGYVIKHELKPGEPREVPGAMSVEVKEEEREGKRVPVLEAKCPPMSADLIRWLYARHNPAANLNFGPGPAEELRSKFTLKLWNTYAFFCNYARLDRFDPNAPRVLIEERPDIDRWVLSDLQQLIQTARTAFESFDVQTFCLEAEKFVDDKVSNWYVRRNRRRFWKSEHGPDKLAAYQTLYTVLVTLAKLIAPIMPFLAEVMYQHLVVKQGLGEGSVHHCDYPLPDEALIDEELSADMDALLDLVTLGSAARNTVTLKRRQPLAEMKVQPALATEGDRPEEQQRKRHLRRAAERFQDQLTDELNVKTVTLQESGNGSLLQVEVKPNRKTLGPKFGSQLRDVQDALEAADGLKIAVRVKAGLTISLRLADGSEVELEPADVVVQQRAPEGWAGVEDHGTQVVIDTRVTEELAREGMARDIVRHVQELRKKANLEMSDYIALQLVTPSERLRSAIEAHREYISKECLVREWPSTDLSGADVHQAEVKVDGQPLTIKLRRLPPA